MNNQQLIAINSLFDSLDKKYINVRSDDQLQSFLERFEEYSKINGGGWNNSSRFNVALKYFWFRLTSWNEVY